MDLQVQGMEKLFQNGQLYGNLEPIEGAELHRVIDSEDSIVAIFDGEHFREVKK